MGSRSRMPTSSGVDLYAVSSPVHASVDRPPLGPDDTAAASPSPSDSRRGVSALPHIAQPTISYAAPSATRPPRREPEAQQMLVDEADGNSFRATSTPIPSPDLPSPSSPTTAVSRAGPNPFASSLSRDALLNYAYHLYDSPGQTPSGMTSVPQGNPKPQYINSEQIYRLQLLPLLITLRSLHQQDPAVLLLLACTYYALADFDASIAISLELSRIDPSSAEALNNIGTAMRAQGRNDQAYEWWWKALQRRPIYWDAMDNLLGFLLSSAQTSQNENHSATLYARALDVCTFVQRKAIDEDGRFLLSVPAQQLHRLQKVFFTSATLQMMRQDGTQDAVRDYFRGVEMVIRPPAPYADDDAHTMRELILATFFTGYLVQTPSNGSMPVEITESLGFPPGTSLDALSQAGMLDVLRVVKTSGNQLLKALLRMGGNTLPFLLLLPEHVGRLPKLLFHASGGVLPGMCSRNPDGSLLPSASDTTVYQTNSTTSTIFLALAKWYQDDLASSEVAIPGFEDTLNINHSLSILFYYLALSLNPAPSTYNNMGIILSATVSTTAYTAPDGSEVVLSGSTLAKVYYNAGLQLDPTHPHLLTNLGSLYKDQGELEKSITLYSKAIVAKPDFDIALANLGNAIKDAGRAWEAIMYYRRALQYNPNLPEAVCGLVSSMASVCDWRGRDGCLDGFAIDEAGNLLPANIVVQPGYMKKMVDICQVQLDAAYQQNIHCVRSMMEIEDWLRYVGIANGRPLGGQSLRRWQTLFGQFYERAPRGSSRRQVNEGGFAIRFINWLQPRLQRRWYIELYGKAHLTTETVSPPESSSTNVFLRPTLPKTMTPPSVPSILPFNTFIYPLPERMIRLISHRNALRITYVSLSQPWIPRHVYPPPTPPMNGALNIGYVSNDVNNHPLSHLMLSVFGLHDRTRFKVYLYTTSPWDGTSYRPRISREVETFVDASSWSSQQIVEHIVEHRIHVLVNLGGYTKGTRNDVFAARPCPVQMQLMGYAGTLGAAWCDYLVCDPIACPRELSGTELWRLQANGQYVDGEDSLDFDADLDPEGLTNRWLFAEKFIYMPHTFMVTDHRQSFRMDENISVEDRSRTPVSILWKEEEIRRSNMRQNIFPDLPQDTVIFANFNQLYKVDPVVYATWLRILARVPDSILWLLRFPAAGEEHLRRTASLWQGEHVASRIYFTDAAPKDEHIHRGRVADLFLDTFECNAHTIAADILWPGTPILTFPRHRHKMCSRVAASMVHATGFGDRMTVHNIQEYEDRAVALATSLKYTRVMDHEGKTIMRGEGELIDLRRNLFLNRDRVPLFDTVRWTRNIEKAYSEAWRRWVEGTQFEMSDEWEACTGPEKESGCIWVEDHAPVDIIEYDRQQFESAEAYVS